MKRLSQIELIVLLAMLTALVAISIDAMLPALPQIGADLSPDNLNNAQLILTSFLVGLGLGTFFTGPLSDTFGRKPVILTGIAVYIVGAVLAWRAQSLETMIAARIFQGIGAAGPRIVAIAIIRDLYAGRQMARLVSFVMIIFTLVPAIAPTMGAVLIDLAGWRSIFLVLIIFSGIGAGWLWLRQPESLAPEHRRPFSSRAIASALQEMAAHPMVRLSILVQSLAYGMLFAELSSTQQIFDQTFGYGETFHFWFGGIALLSGSASILNAVLVVRLGMRLLVSSMLLAQIGFSATMILIWNLDLPDVVTFGAFVVWTATVFFQAGLTLGNLNALAMEPMGHIAGIAASVIGSVATVFGVAIAVPIGLAFDGTPMPLAISILCASLIGYVLTQKMRKLERPGQPSG